jgi:hypothetical protein
MTDTPTPHDELDQFIESLDLDYSATFVPQSVSRNSKLEYPTLNWNIRLGLRSARADAAPHMYTDYMQGVGHVPSSGQQNAKRNRTAEKYAAETGLYCLSRRGDSLVRVPVPSPLLRDVLYSLLLDADACNYTSFEDWATEMGLDSDSRSAERMFFDCRAAGRALQNIIPEPAMSTLRELFADY